MKFEATEDQVRMMAVLAVRASSPMGMGHLHFNADQVFKPEDLKFFDGHLSLDYVQGRMVKLSIKRIDNNHWETRDTVDVEYQSWVSKYPSYKALVDAAKKVERLESKTPSDNLEDVRVQKSKNDIQLKMAKHQGYVPNECYLDGPLVMLLVAKGEDPCGGCNLDRSICNGRPRN